MDSRVSLRSPEGTEEEGGGVDPEDGFESCCLEASLGADDFDPLEDSACLVSPFDSSFLGSLDYLDSSFLGVSLLSDLLSLLSDLDPP